MSGGCDVRNIYILMGFHQGLIIIKYEKVILKNPSECADSVNLVESSNISVDEDESSL